MPCRAKNLGVWLFAVLVAAPYSALSQDEEAIVVEGTRFPEQVERLPASVTVLSAEDIARSSARTLPELLAGQVGIGSIDLYGNNAALASVDMRGFGVTGPQNTLVLVDGRRVSDIDLSGVQWSAIPLSGVERIEILRGSGAVLYGDGASAGVINIVTRSPLKQEKRLDIYGRVGSYRTAEGQLYGALANSTFGLNASVYGYGSDGYRDNNRNEQRNGTLNARWGIGQGALDLRVGIDRQDLRLPGARTVQPSAGLDEYAADPRGTSTPLDYSSRDGQRAGATFTQKVGEAEISIGLDWRDKDQGSYFDFGGYPSYRADALDVVSLTPRVRLPLATGAWRHRLTIGADGHAWRYDSRRTNLPENVAQPVNRVRVTEDISAIYLHDLVQATATTQLSLGWRTERVVYDAQDTLDPSAPGFDPFASSEAPPVHETMRQQAWEIGLRQALNPRWSLFARGAQTFRFANVDEIYENDASFSAQFQILRPQRARTYEAGTEWRSGTASARVALFRTNVHDEIHLDPFSTGVGNTNLPLSRRQGAEINARWQAGTRLQLSAAYAYIDARFLEGVLPGSGYAIGTDLDIAGNQVPLVPRHKLNFGLAWDIAQRTRLSGALTAVSEQYMDNDEPNSLGTMIPAYKVVDVKLAQSLAWGRLALAVNNLFAERYYTYGVRSAFIADRYSVYPLPGRTISLTAELALR